MNIDFLIKNGHVIDPKSGIDDTKDVAISNNKIVEIKDNDIVNKVIDASGCYVLPGLIDFHAHIFDTGANTGVHPDYLLAIGVTSAVDPGTAGTSNFDAFYMDNVMHSKVRIKSYLCPYGSGQLDYNIIEKYDKDEYRYNDIRKIVDRYADNILGLKLRMSKGVAKNIEALEAAIEIAEELGIGINVHTSNPITPLKEVATRLRKGDIYCHCYQDWGDESILDENGHVKDFILDARQRGVIMDAANGRMNFNIECCKKALEDGFYPDVISSDWTGDKFNLSNTAKNLTFIMAKYLELGMPLFDIVRCVTEAPAKLMNMEGKIGTLGQGAYADISIFKIIEKKSIHLDSDNNKFIVNKLFVPQLVFVDGEPAFCQAYFSLDI